MKATHSLASLSLLSLALLAGCGGGGGGGGSAPTTTGAADTVSQGTITGFGSVIVDGVRYSTVGASIIDEDGNLSRDALRIGMSVNVQGSSSDDLTTGEARVIDVRRLLQGPVSGLSGTTGAQTFAVLSQRVSTTPDTLIAGDLADAANVRIYGLLQQDAADPLNNRIVASRIEVVPQTRFEAYGQVTALDSAGFALGGLTVTPASGTPLPTGLTLGSLVKVSCSDLPACSDGSTQMTASKIRLRGVRHDLAGGELVKLKGVIEAVNGNLLTVNDIPVDISNATRGDRQARSTWAPQVGQRIEIKGRYTGTTLVARRIEQEGFRASRHEGTAEAYSTELYGLVDANATDCGTLGGDYLVQSVCVSDSSTTLPTVGSYVEVKGNMTGDLLVAIQVERRSGSQPRGGYIEAKGLVTGLDTGTRTFLLNGVTVSFANATLERGRPLADDLFVEVKGTLDALGVFQASKLEVEDGRD